MSAIPILNTVCFGRTRTGNELTEFRIGTGARSVLFLCGFSEKDAPLSALLSTWGELLCDGSDYGEIDRDALNGRCCIRLIPVLNPDCVKINRFGIFKNSEESWRNAVFTQNISAFSAKTKRVDLNRNFNSDWIALRNGGISCDSCGPFPESEAEVHALCRHVKADPPNGAMILRYGRNALYRSSRCKKEDYGLLRLAARYAALPFLCAEDEAGSALGWFADRSVRTAQVALSLPRKEAHGTPADREIHRLFALFTALCTADPT